MFGVGLLVFVGLFLGCRMSPVDIDHFFFPWDHWDVEGICYCLVIVSFVDVRVCLGKCVVAVSIVGVLGVRCFSETE